jgi:DNA-directed RNA polymerase subunit RPC12/RpoP
MYLVLIFCSIWALGYCHEDCSISSVSLLSTNGELERLTTCKQCHRAKLLAPNIISDESPTSPLILQGQENSSRIIFKGPRPKADHSDTKQVSSVSVSKGSKRKCPDQTLSSTRKKKAHPDTKQATSDFNLVESSSRRYNNCSWGLIWKKKSNEENTDFRIKNILLKGGSNMPDLSPVCNLCSKAYRDDLMYIRCETCQSKFFCCK